MADYRTVEAQLVDEQQHICLLADAVLQREHTVRAPLRTLWPPHHPLHVREGVRVRVPGRILVCLESALAKRASPLWKAEGADQPLTASNE